MGQVKWENRTRERRWNEKSEGKWHQEKLPCLDRPQQTHNDVRNKNTPEARGREYKTVRKHNTGMMLYTQQVHERARILRRQRGVTTLTRGRTTLIPERNVRDLGIYEAEEEEKTRERRWQQCFDNAERFEDVVNITHDIREEQETEEEREARRQRFAASETIAEEGEKK